MRSFDVMRFSKIHKEFPLREDIWRCCGVDIWSNESESYVTPLQKWTTALGRQHPVCIRIGEEAVDAR